MNTQRRTFRGRGGATDRQLPKHNARRRRHTSHPHKPATNKYQQDDDDNNNDETAIENMEVDNDNHSSEESSSSSVDDEQTTNQQQQQQQQQAETLVVVEETSTTALPEVPEDTTNNNGQEDEKSNNTNNPCVKEVHHLKKRVRNIRETLSLSNSISNPKTYQDNVLNAVANCLNEWRSIATHYPPVPEDTSNSDAINVVVDEDDEDTPVYMTSELRKQASLAVFEMIQQATQAGPLAGSKPGYFKRCGGEVAKVVETFLDQVIPQAPATIDLMGFTTKQMGAMETWRKNAQKAALENKPPSRSALKHQQGKGTGKKAKKKMKGK